MIALGGSMDIAANEQPRFEKAEWALKYAYIAEAIKGNPGKLSLYFSKDTQTLDDFQLFMRRITAGTSKEDIIADGVMLKNTLMRHLDQKSGRMSRWVISAKYRIPNDKFLAYMKHSDYRSLAGEIKKINRDIGKKEFVVDAVRGYMEGEMHRTPEQWARELSVSDKTIYRRMGSREPGYKSVRYLLSAWEEEAMYYINQKLVELGQLL